MIKECEYCGEPIEENKSVYQIRIYNKNGDEEFVKCCSERCADRCKLMSYTIHNEMAYQINRSQSQKFKNNGE